MQEKFTPDVTVAVMSYNNARYIEQTIDSILAQTGVSFEVFVFDDCSSDHSAELLKKYSTDPRFHYEVNPSNLGMTGNYNKCVEAGKGKYVVVLGSDDIIYPGHLAALHSALELHPESPLAYTQCNWIDEDGKLIKYAQHPGHWPHSYFGHRDEVVDLLRHDNYITPSAVMLRREILDKIRLASGVVHRPDLLAGDWELWTRIARSFPDFIFLHQATVGYRIHGSQVSQSFYNSEKPLLEHAEILELNLDDRAARPRLLAARDDIWGLFQARISVYSPEIREKHSDRIEAVRRLFFDPQPIEGSTAPVDGIEPQAREFRPLVSVVMPTFNRPFMLRTALESVCNQTYTNWEAIVVNDAGKDVSETVAQSACHGKITLINHETNKGLSAARNTALRAAKGSIICYLDDDDLFKPDHLDSIVSAFTQHNHDFAYVDAEYVSEQLDGEKRIELGRSLHSPDLPQSLLLTKNFIPVNCWAHKRECLQQVGFFDETLKTHEDWELLIRFSRKYRLVHIPKATVEVRQRASADNMLRTIRLLDTFDLIYKRYPTRDETLRDQRRQMLAYVANNDRLISRNGVFPEGWLEEEYLRSNPDVASLVEQHAIDSGYSHYLAFGQFENRPCASLDSFFQKFQSPTDQEVSSLAQSDAHTYSLWLEAVRIRSDHPLLGKFSSRSSHAPITVAIATRGAKDRLEKTRHSIDAQLRLAKQVLILAEGDSLPVQSDEQASDWTLLLNEGDTLEADALLLLEHTLARIGTEATRVVYFDHDEVDAADVSHTPNFKPDFNHDLLLSYPYMGRALLVRSHWAQPYLAAANGQFNLALAYRLALQANSETGSASCVHLAALIAHLRSDEPTVFANTSEAWQDLAQISASYLETTSPGTQLIEGPAPGTFHLLYPLARTPLVSIVIPTRDQLHFLSRCIESLLEKTNYPNFEVLVVDNDSQTLEAQEFLAGLAQLAPERIRVLHAPGAFNFSRMNNLAVQEARGEFILMLNNDTAALQPDWLTHMVRNALRDDVGIVGARLLYPDGRLQHAGVILGLRGPAEHPFLGLEASDPGYLCRAQVQQDFSAVTAACLLVRKSLYQELGGLDEIAFGVSYNDVDFCLRVGQTGKRIVWTPLATLLHEGSASQKNSIEASTEEMKVARFTREQASMYQRWPKLIANDPAYNPNLSLAEHGYEIETNTLLRFDKLQGLTEKRVLAFAADDHGCGQYRILQPLQAMREAGLCTGGASPEMLGPNLVLRSGADTLVFQRPNDDISLDILESLIPLKGIKKIYEVDDNLSRVPLKSAHHQLMPKNLRGRITKAIGLCDRLVVSTEALAHELAGKCGDTRVILNRLSPAMWGQVPPRRPTATQRPPSSKPRVGWAGGAGHLGDLEMIAEVIRDLADQVDWIFFGMCPDSIRPYVHEFYEGIPTLDYPKALMAQDWDLAIAPLEVNPFNECKSNLKLLEYGWCGVPVVCSDITPYQGDLPATRVKNRFKDWRSAILEHIADLDASRRMGLALQEQVAKDWMLTGDNLQSWYAAWTD